MAKKKTSSSAQRQPALQNSSTSDICEKSIDSSSDIFSSVYTLYSGDINVKWWMLHLKNKELLF